jgi:MoaA/NifB/PqqE/SkfB family radical SAM enzyme
MQPNFNILKEAQPSYIVYSRDFPTPEKQAAMRGINICDDEIISSLRILKTQGALLQINTVLFSDNYEQLLQFIEHPAIQEIDFWHLIPVKGKMQKCWSNTSSLRLINTILPELEDRLRNKSVQLFFPDLQTSQPPFEAVTVGHKNRPIQCTFKDVSLNVLPDKSVYTCNCFDWKDRMLFKLGSIDRHSLADCIRRRKTPNFISGLSKTLCLFCDPINDNLEHLLTNES